MTALSESFILCLTNWPSFYVNYTILTRISIIKFPRQGYCWEIKVSVYTKFHLAQSSMYFNSASPWWQGVSLVLLDAEGKYGGGVAFPGLMRDVESLKANMEPCFVYVLVLASLGFNARSLLPLYLSRPVGSVWPATCPQTSDSVLFTVQAYLLYHFVYFTFFHPQGLPDL